MVIVNSAGEIVNRVKVDPERGPFRPKKGLQAITEAEAEARGCKPPAKPLRGAPVPMAAFMRALREQGLLTSWKKWVKDEQVADEVATLREIGPGVLYFDTWTRATGLDEDARRALWGSVKRAQREIFG